MDPVDLGTALTDAIGESDAEIGGTFSTYLTAQAAEGATSLTVATTVGWLSAGQLAIEGQIYTYTGITATTFTGIERDVNGTPTSGTAKLHRDRSVVVDINRSRSSLDQLRRATLVEYAVSDDLDVVGRNLSVFRDPSLVDDETYRAIIKATAYNPRGTMYGLELALDALVGAGNYEILEDLINYPCTVFIRLVGGSTSENGKFFTTQLLQKKPASDQTFVLDDTPTKVANVFVTPIDQYARFGVVKPSGVNWIRYVGDAGTPLWTFVGTNEATEVTLANGHVVMTDNAAGAGVYYERQVNPVDSTRSTMNFRVGFRIPAAATLDGTNGRQFALTCYDGNRMVEVGSLDDSGNIEFGFWNELTGSMFSASTILLKDVWYDVEIKKFGESHAELWVNGKLIERLPYTSFPNGAFGGGTKFRFGAQDDGATGMIAHVSYAHIGVDFGRDYWSMFTFNVSTTVTERLVEGGGGSFLSSDVGKTVKVTNSALSNGTGGNNNGVYEISSFISATTVVVTGILNEVALDIPAAGNNVTIRRGEFVFPDDLGKSVVITGSILGNNVTRLVTDLKDENGVSYLTKYGTASGAKFRARTAVVDGAALVAESGLNYKLNPNFIVDTCDIEVFGCGLLSGLNATIRDTLPDDDFEISVVWTEVFSGQVLLDPSIQNLYEGAFSSFDRYPVYAFDPFAALRGYVDGFLAAGVTPEYFI